MTELQVKVLVNSKLSVVSINSNCNEYQVNYTYLLIKNSNILSILKRIVPETEDIFNYQDLIFQVKNFYCKTKKMEIDRNFTFTNNCNLMFDNIIQFPLNQDYLNYQKQPININLKNKDNYLEIIFCVNLLKNIGSKSNSLYLTNNSNIQTNNFNIKLNNSNLNIKLNNSNLIIKPNTSNLIIKPNNSNLNTKHNNSNLNSNTNQGLTNTFILSKINNLELEDKVSNLKKVSIPNILSYVKYYFTSKYHIDKSNFLFCQDSNEIKDEYLKFVFIHYQWMDKIFNNITNYLKIKKYNITTFQYCLCDKYLKLTINLKRSKRPDQQISFKNSYYKPILDKYNIDLPNPNFQFNFNGNTNLVNKKQKETTQFSLMDNINDICKMMDISLQFNLQIHKNTNQIISHKSSKVKRTKLLVIKIPLIKEVKPREINTLSYMYLQK